MSTRLAAEYDSSQAAAIRENLEILHGEVQPKSTQDQHLPPSAATAVPAAKFLGASVKILFSDKQALEYGEMPPSWRIDSDDASFGNEVPHKLKVDSAKSVAAASASVACKFTNKGAY